MTEDTRLKLVKTNERVEKKTKYSRYGSARTEDVKVHDLELHHAETGEPIFSVHKEYGQGKYSLKWHPYMTDTHPDLERSFEHGSRHADHNRMRSDSGKEYLAHHGARLYDAAARSGFKDTFPHKLTPTPTEGDPHAHKITFHDPDSGEAMVHATNSGYGGGNRTADKDYLAKHNIHPNIALQAKGGAYGMAQTMHAEKGRAYSAVGSQTHGMYFSKYNTTGKAEPTASHTLVFKKGKADMSDEQLSQAHEAKIREKHGNVEGFKLNRIAPTVFTHSRGGDGVTARTRIHSIAEGGMLYHHNLSPNDSGGNTDRF